MIILSFDIGIKNLAYCLLDSQTHDILDWYVIDCSVNKNNDVIIKLIDELEKMPQLLECDTILIEKQPSFNPQMRIISTAVYVYFAMRINYEQQRKIKIQYYSAKNKLKLCQNTLSIQSKYNTQLKGQKAKRNAYTCNKKAAIEQTQIFITNKIDTQNYYNSYLKYFTSSKKKDDLADCYLQALSYLL